MSSLPIHELIHFSVSLICGIILGKVFKNYRLVFPVVFVGLLIDLDHLIDYFLYVGSEFLQKPIINPLSALYFDFSQRVYVPLHAWEIVIIAVFFFWKTKKPLLITIALAAAHLLVDQFTYETHVLSYSLLYRLSHNFSMASFKQFKF